MLELYPGELNVDKIFSKWRRWGEDKNYGAFITFVGTVREENGIEALSFDVYKPILQRWFEAWQQRAQQRGAYLKMAHSIGNVPIHTSSYMAAVFSPKRRVALELIEEFVEDFKANAPIWKYDVKNGERIYARDRSHKIEGSGLLDSL
ncbi:molybdopterin synthase catalytic subunit [Nitratiruptor tergarcus]|uniref:Molybdopterin synthase catalytic subunit n=1 Tax=Nitratiruptor tergarcus DSM 16512 TaxID=1069081 RepID=A0A1W1WQG4_9BACT|nr:molybdenum cofactor biosynthesis protein MoaE [Nitratiruptor tergarcus]SMC08486.1 molybdopterin synthase catalytic subunit [Nitratiruptor tergarcus DSM 16512]